MIIVSVLGLIILMVVMFMVIRTYTQDKSVGSYVQTEELVKKNDAKVEYSTTLLVLVEKITEDKIVGFDIENKAKVSRKITEATRISDMYGSAIPVTQIKTGDIIEVVYQNEKEKVISIGKTSKVKSWKKITGVTIDHINQQINIGGTAYPYIDDTMVFQNNGRKTNLSFVTPFDVVSIQSVDDIIWSITINEEAGSITVTDTPNTEGSLEIDRTRTFKLDELKNNIINVIPGNHSILLQMKGYEMIKEDIVIAPGENYKISLKDAPIAYTNINPLVSSGIEEYTIKIGDKVYNKGEEIKLQQGTYEVQAEAEGYELWTKEIICDKETYNLYISFTEKPTPSESPSLSEETNEVLNNTQTITLDTNPPGAKVYINGVYKGETPCTVTLINGSYGVLFEKADYDAYATTILLDGSDEKINYLYDLIAH